MRNLALEKIQTKRKQRREYLFHGTNITVGIGFGLFELFKPLFV